jgi:uncharacterized protein YndB with AHSA1/START domain
MRSKTQTEIVAKREYRYPVERVFRAWFDKETVGSWLFATEGGVSERVDIDPRVGGAFAIAERREGKLVEHFGHYTEIDPPRRLAFNFTAEPGEEPTTVTVNIRQTDDGSEIVLRHCIAPEWSEKHEEIQSAWQEILDRLAVALRTDALTLTREFAAPPAVVWRAWTEPELLKRWYGAVGYTAPECEIDLRVGGKLHACMRSPEGNEIWFGGVYRLIEPPTRLVVTDYFSDEQGNVLHPTEVGLTDDWPRVASFDISFEPIVPDRTMLKLKHLGVTTAQAKRVGEDTGWMQSFEKLDALLEELP